MDTSSPVLVAVIAVGTTVDVVCLVISALKAKVAVTLVCIVLSFSFFGLYGLGVLGSCVPVVCACRLARPSSFWARRFYGPEKLARAAERFA